MRALQDGLQRCGLCAVSLLWCSALWRWRALRVYGSTSLYSCTESSLQRAGPRIPATLQPRRAVLRSCRRTVATAERVALAAPPAVRVACLSVGEGTWGPPRGGRGRRTDSRSSSTRSRGTLPGCLVARCRRVGVRTRPRRCQRRHQRQRRELRRRLQPRGTLRTDARALTSEL